MNKDKLKKLETYKAKIESMLSSPIPEKHKDSPHTFIAFLNNELRIVKAQIEEVKLGA